MQVRTRCALSLIADLLVFLIGVVATLVVSMIAGLAALGIGRAIGESESVAHIQEGFATGVVLMLMTYGHFMNLRRKRPTLES